MGYTQREREALAKAEHSVLEKHGMLNNMPNESAKQQLDKAERYQQQQTVYGKMAMPMLDELAQAMTKLVNTSIKSGRVSKLTMENTNESRYYD